MNDACCSRPAAETEQKPVGSYEKVLGDMNLYITGPSNSVRGVILIYDAFGYTDSLLHGADILAESLSAQVFVPDFYYGNGIPPTLFPVDSGEKKAILQEWITGPGAFDKGLTNLLSIQAEIASKHTPIAKWACFGFCWGGKVVAMSSDNAEPFAVSGTAHPGRLDPKEAKAFKIPHLCMYSGEDGTDEELAKYDQALRSNGSDVRIEYFTDQVHGWMAARANLGDEKAKAAYEKGYTIAADFFGKYI